MDLMNIQFEAWKIISTETNELENLKVPNDLVGLYGDIRVRLSQIAPDYEYLIDEYNELMIQEQKLCSPEMAYLSGHEAAQAGCGYMPMDYIKQVYGDTNNQRFLNERDVLFQRLSDLLGDTCGLIIEYTELHRRCNGIINSKIEHFYKLGYYNIESDVSKCAG